MGPIPKTVRTLRSCSVELNGLLKSMYGSYSSVSDMLDDGLFLNVERIVNILFYIIINDLAQVPFEGVLIELYKGTRRNYN